MRIKDITQKYAGDFYRFGIVDLKNGRFALQMEEKKWTEKWGETIRIETSTKRLEQLANEILNYLNKKVKWKEWKPTLAEFEQRLNETWNPDFGMEWEIIEWIRMAVSLGNKSKIKQARRIYEWLKSNEDWLYGRL